MDLVRAESQNRTYSKAYSLIGTVTGNADRSRVPRSRNFRSGSRIGYGVDRTTDRGWNDVPKKLDREEEQRIVLGGRNLRVQFGQRPSATGDAASAGGAALERRGVAAKVRRWSGGVPWLGVRHWSGGGVLYFRACVDERKTKVLARGHLLGCSKWTLSALCVAQ
jgi:hypothetical protein